MTRSPLPDAVARTVARGVVHRPVGPAAILRLHHDESEDVLLPIRDRSLVPDAAADLFARTGEHAHA